MHQACGTDGADDTYCLDDCSGYEGLVPEMDDFTYRYYLVREEIVVCVMVGLDSSLTMMLRRYIHEYFFAIKCEALYDTPYFFRRVSARIPSS